MPSAACESPDDGFLETTHSVVRRRGGVDGDLAREMCEEVPTHSSSDQGVRALTTDGSDADWGSSGRGCESRRPDSSRLADPGRSGGIRHERRRQSEPWMTPALPQFAHVGFGWCVTAIAVPDRADQPR